MLRGDFLFLTLKSVLKMYYNFRSVLMIDCVAVYWLNETL